MFANVLALNHELSMPQSQKTPVTNSKLTALPDEPVARLLAVMAALRDPVGGCPWDLKQDFVSLTKYTLEEAYEVVEAVEKQDFPALRDELGDLLLQIVFYAQMGREAGHFDFIAIATTLSEKLIRRHPHVFGDEHIATAEAMTERWEAYKAKERAEKPAPATPSALDGLTSTLPALSYAQKLVQRATRVGFDWDKPEDCFPKIMEELEELRVEVAANQAEKMVDELGDVFFSVICLAHKLHIDPETALRQANRKFERRFRGMESHLSDQIAQKQPILLEDWEKAWREVKSHE